MKGFIVAVLVVATLDGSVKDQDGHRAYDRGDFATAYREFLPLAKQGDVRAQHQLGVMLFHGQGVQKNSAEAALWYRRAAEQGYAPSQTNLAIMHQFGQGIPQNFQEALVWYRRAADQGIAAAQHNLGSMYENGQGVAQNIQEAVGWYRRAGEQGTGTAQANAQFQLGLIYATGRGMPQNFQEALVWYGRAAGQGHASAQHNLGVMFSRGQGVAIDLVLAHMWFSLGARSPGPAQEISRTQRDALAQQLTPEQLARAQQLAAEWKPAGAGTDPRSAGPPSPSPAASSGPAVRSYGSGIVVTKAGQIVTNAHVVQDCQEVRTGVDLRRTVASVRALDRQNDLALLTTAMPADDAATFREGRGVKQGDSVVVVGFPLRGVVASSASLTVGTVSALAGIHDDTRYLQITAPIQQGNSGGPLLDQSGRVVGIVVAQLNALQIAQQTGNIPQNVNFALHSSIVRTFLDAHGVDYAAAPTGSGLQTSDIAERAKRYTVVVECWK
jgi:TPR repeat protein